jgi:hypothetical protein
LPFVVALPLCCLFSRTKHSEAIPSPTDEPSAAALDLESSPVKGGHGFSGRSGDLLIDRQRAATIVEGELAKAAPDVRAKQPFKAAPMGAWDGGTLDIDQTQGKVWVITTLGPKQEGDFTVVSTLNLGSSVQYRVVGEVVSQPGAVPTEPSLEDGYVWLMREQRAPVRTGVV